MGFEIKKWLDQQLEGEELTAEERQVIEKHFVQESVAKRIEADSLRKSDYSKRMDDLAQSRKMAQEEQAAAEKAYQAKIAELSTWEQKTKKTVETLNGRVAELQKTSSSREEALRKASGEYGFDVKEFLTGAPAQNGNSGSASGQATGFPEGFDPNDYMTTEQFKKALTEISNVYGPYPVALQRISAEHFKLFGEIPDLTETYAEHVKTGKPIDELYVKNFKVVEKLDEIRQGEVDTALAKAKQDGYDEAMRKATALPDATEPDLLSSPALRLTAKIQQERNKGKDNTPQLSAVQKAVLSHQKKIDVRAAAAAGT